MTRYASVREMLAAVMCATAIAAIFASCTDDAAAQTPTPDKPQAQKVQYQRAVCWVWSGGHGSVGSYSACEVPVAVVEPVKVEHVFVPSPPPPVAQPLKEKPLKR